MNPVSGVVGGGGEVNETALFRSGDLEVGNIYLR